MNRNKYFDDDWYHATAKNLPITVLFTNEMSLITNLMDKILLLLRKRGVVNGYVGIFSASVYCLILVRSLNKPDPNISIW